MDNLKIGQIITSEQRRDAVHVAVVPVIAGEILEPGADVLIAGGLAWQASAEDRIGVVDPFLKTYVNDTETFWLFLTPGSITSLRHEWTHPAFPIEEGEGVDEQPTGEAGLDAYRAEKKEASEWMQAWCDAQADEGYERKLTFALAIQFGREMHVSEFEDARDNIDDEWWRNWEILTGKKAPAKDDRFFSCSC